MSKQNTARHRFAVVAGGTGGHLFPALATLEELKRRGHRARLLCDKRAVHHLARQKVALKTTRIFATSPRGGIFAKLRFVPLFALGFLQSLGLFVFARPTAVLVFGGYLSAPTAVAAWFLRVPVVLHEQNRVLGWANRSIARFAHTLALSFTNTDGLDPRWQNRAVVTGMPVRHEIRQMAHQPYAPPKEGEKIRLLVLGGSQGAEAFDALLPEALARLRPVLLSRLSLTQQTNKATALQTRYDALNLTCALAPYFADIAERMAAADIVIARAGASTVAELMAVARAGLLIPYPHATEDHQRHNARAFAEAGGGIVLEQDAGLPEALAQALQTWLENPSRIESAAGALRALPPSSATEDLADSLEQVAKSRKGANFARAKSADQSFAPPRKQGWVL